MPTQPMPSTQCPSLSVEIEDRPSLLRPRRERVMAEIAGLTPRGGPSFLILSGTGCDYMQTAGGDGAYLVEWRDYAGDTFRHFTAGRHGPVPDEWIVIPTKGFHVSVRPNERLTCTEVQSLAADFIDARGRSHLFAWRETTMDFLEG